MKLRSLVFSALVAIAAADVVNAQSATLSTTRLQRLSERFEADVAASAIPGAVVLIFHKGRVRYFESFGFRNRITQSPMSKNAIFRIASMTKPVTVVAALMLAEEGKLRLHDPVSLYLPELKDMKVGVEVRDGAGERQLITEPARRPITIHDLMRHTSGLTYGIFGDSLVQRANRAADTMNDQQTNAELVTKLAQLPLAYQPGTTFEYGMSQDVLGRVIEVISGMDLNRFVRERIAQPLGMRDTGFLLSEEQVARLAEPHGNPITQAPAIVGYNPAKPPKWFSGGAGLLSTAQDYARFCQMLLNGGKLGDVRILSRKSVELMTHDHLPPGTAYGPFALELGITAPVPALGQSYGLGVGVREQTGLSPVPGSIGDYFWGGATGPYFWIDPKENLIAVMMLQELDLQRRTQYRSVMRNLVYQALE
jgi:CubicO group peptidase (beta-lactamase class C family)